MLMGYVAACTFRSIAVSFLRRSVGQPNGVTILKVKPGCFLFLVSVAATRATAQAPTTPLRVVPPPPLIAADAASGKPAHQATQSGIDPEHAFDPATGDGYNWDCVKKTWINTRTKESIGFAGDTGRGGEIIPPPPLISGNQPQINHADPDHALEAKTATSLVWDRDTKTWRDTRTNKGIGYQGVVLRDACPSTRGIANVAPRGVPVRLLPGRVLNRGTPSENFAVGVHYEYRSFYKLKEVSSNSPLVLSNDVTPSTNGVGGFVGGKIPGLPAFGTVNGYWSTGLATNAMLSNGHRAQSDLTDYGAGVGIRLMPGGMRRFSPYAFANAIYEWNRSTYNEFNTAGTSVLSEPRTHKTWTGEYGVGEAFWLTSQFGIATEVSYNGIFKNTNADENFKVSAGLVLRLGQ